MWARIDHASLAENVPGLCFATCSSRKTCDAFRRRSKPTMLKGSFLRHPKLPGHNIPYCHMLRKHNFPENAFSGFHLATSLYLYGCLWTHVPAKWCQFCWWFQVTTESDPEQRGPAESSMVEPWWKTESTRHKLLGFVNNWIWNHTSSSAKICHPAGWVGKWVNGPIPCVSWVLRPRLQVHSNKSLIFWQRWTWF